MPSIIILLLSRLKLIPSKDWIYIGIILAAAFGFLWYTAHERHVGATKLQTAINAASKKADAAADKKIAELTRQHTEDVSNIEDHYETLLASADSQHDSDLKRLHDAEGSSKANGNMESSPSSDKAADLWKGRFARLGDISAKLATALRKDDAALEACYAERDSLTGKP